MRTLLVVAVSLLILGVVPASATTYTGSLTYTAPPPPDSGDGIYVIGIAGQWPDYDVTMSWTVTDEDPYDTTYLWKYTYTFDLEYSDTWGAISHIIIEGSEGISSDDIIGTTGALVDTVGYQAVNLGFDDMPEDMWGINFDPPTTDDYFTMTWSFWSNRVPVWGDFYARCGGGPGGDEINKAYNYNNDGLGTELGFLDPNGLDDVLDDIDPIAPPSNGSIDYHILRPNSYIPEPGAIGLVAFAGLLAVRRRK